VLVPIGSLRRCSYFSQWAGTVGLPVGGVCLPDFTLALQLGEFGLLCEDLVAPLLHCGLHGGDVVGCLVEIYRSRSSNSWCSPVYSGWLSSLYSTNLHQGESSVKAGALVVAAVNAPRCCSGTALVCSDPCRPNLAPGPTSTFHSSTPTNPHPARRPRHSSPDSPKRCIVIADPDYLPLDIYKPDSVYRRPSHDRHNVHLRRCQRTHIPSKEPGTRFGYTSKAWRISRDAGRMLTAITTGPPMVRTRFRCLLRRLPPAVIKRSR
jgi:hypothetical protein